MGFHSFSIYQCFLNGLSKLNGWPNGDLFSYTQARMYLRISVTDLSWIHKENQCYKCFFLQHSLNPQGMLSGYFWVLVWPHIQYIGYICALYIFACMKSDIFCYNITTCTYIHKYCLLAHHYYRHILLFIRTVDGFGIWTNHKYCWEMYVCATEIN